MQGLIRVDVSNAGDQILIKEGGLDRSARVSDSFTKRFVPHLKGVGSDHLPFPFHHHFHPRPDPETSESSWVPPDEPRSLSRRWIFERPDQVCVVRYMIRIHRYDEQLPTHSQTEFQHPTIFDFKCQSLSMSVKPMKRTTSEQ